MFAATFPLLGSCLSIDLALGSLMIEHEHEHEASQQARLTS